MAKVEKSPKVFVDKALDINKDGYSNGGIDIETPSQNVDWDPRTKTLAAGMQRNVLPQGDKVEVKGTKRMLKSKNKTATWY
tara:strand:+ start:2780 stop:3022 length:243 start_codon:yes stop_codon:yes gene_type:complete